MDQGKGGVDKVSLLDQYYTNMWSRGGVMDLTSSAKVGMLKMLAGLWYHHHSKTNMYEWKKKWYNKG